MSYQLTPLPPPIDFAAVLSGQDKYWIRYDVGRDPKSPNHALCNVSETKNRSKACLGLQHLTAARYPGDAMMASEEQKCFHSLLRIIRKDDLLTFHVPNLGHIRHRTPNPHPSRQ